MAASLRKLKYYRYLPLAPSSPSVTKGHWIKNPQCGILQHCALGEGEYEGGARKGNMKVGPEGKYEGEAGRGI